MGLRILITNLELWPPSGTVVYTRDLALELARQGHAVGVFSSTTGGAADALRAAGVEVIDRLGRLPWTPDVIHGHHYVPTLLALQHWPTVPAIHVCHDHLSADDRTPLHPNIRRHFGVSRVCVRRLLAESVPERSAGLLLNFVDLARFTPRAALPPRPRRALAFSNYAREDGYLPVVREACRRAGLELDVAGAGTDSVLVRPEDVLGQYDLVFAKAKAAMEAMAVGAAVVLCDFAGVGPMVSAAGFDDLRPLNFGFEALRDPLTPEPLLREIGRYDAGDAARVRDQLRASAGLVDSVERIAEIYEEVIEEHRREGTTAVARVSARVSIGDRLFVPLYRIWRSQSPRRMAATRRLPGVAIVTRVARRLLRQTR
jgi:hypothetical protein